MLTRDFSLKVKALDASGTFTGYASTYGGPPDLAGDIIEPGAYRQAIASQGNGYPLLWSHRTDEPIGLARISDSSTGLVAEGKLLLSDPAAQRAYEHLKNGSIKAMSIGYTVPQGEGKVSYADDGTRTLQEVFLHEISLVAVPANPRAIVTTLKSLAQVESVLRGVRPADVTGSTLDQLRSINAALKGLLRKDDGCTCQCGECLAGDCIDRSDTDCTNENCKGSMLAQQREEELASLKAFALELRKADGLKTFWPVHNFTVGRGHPWGEWASPLEPVGDA
jgi:HK97 family phage prohead protease